jgi:hypothetical protein
MEINTSNNILKEVEDLLESLSDEPDESVGGKPCYYKKELFNKIPQLVAEIKLLSNPSNILFRLANTLENISADPLVVHAGKRINELEKELDIINEENKQLRAKKEKLETDIVKNIKYIKWLDKEYKRTYELSHQEQ